MKVIKMIIIIMFIMTIIGCAGNKMTRMCKPGATTDDFNHDYWECKVYAQRYSMQSAAMMGTDTPNTIGDAMGQGIGLGIVQAMEYNKAIMECMRAKGWEICNEN